MNASGADTVLPFNSIQNKYLYVLGDEISSLSPISSNSQVGLAAKHSVANGTTIKNTDNLHFGDKVNGYGLGGFITDDYLSLNGKNLIVFHGTWSWNNQYSGVFEVSLIDESGTITRVYQDLAAEGTKSMNVDVSSYNGNYKIAFYCYGNGASEVTEYATVRVIKFD